MFPIIEEPERLIAELRRAKNCSFADFDEKLLRFLKQQYDYEINRTPRHKAFEANYNWGSFDANAMLRYYMNPWGKETNEQYSIDLESLHSPHPVIHKRTIEKHHKDMSELRKEIEHSINKHSAENASNTPDFILAQYLIDCLSAYDKAVSKRDQWHGLPEMPSKTTKG